MAHQKAHSKKQRHRDIAQDVPVRRCLATGESFPKADLIRFVIGPDASLVPDINNKLPGRGLYIQPKLALIEQACQKHQFARVARQKVNMPDNLAEQLCSLIQTQLSNNLGLARRAGQCLAGFDKVSEALKSGRLGRKGGRPALLLEALDGAADGRQKVTRLAPEAMPIVSALTAVEQGLALGREQAVHIILSKGQLADKILRLSRFLEGLRKLSVTEMS